MNTQKLARNEGYRVRLWPVPMRRMADGVWLPPIDDDWILQGVDNQGVARLRNIRTDHVATLGTDRIHHFDHEPHRDWNDLRLGLLELRVRLVLQGPNIHYVPLPNFRPRQSTALAPKKMP